MLKLSIEEKKNYIVQVATKVFSEKGYKTSSLQDIATRAGLSKAGLYHYFQSKDDLLFYIIITHSDNFISILKKRIKQSEDEHLDPEEAFRKLMKVYARHINSDGDYRLIVLHERHQLTGDHRDELIKREKTLFQLLRQELAKISYLNANLNPNVITFLFISMSHWLGYWVKEKKDLSLDEIIEQNITAVLHGCLSKRI